MNFLTWWIFDMIINQDTRNGTLFLTFYTLHIQFLKSCTVWVWKVKTLKRILHLFPVPWIADWYENESKRLHIVSISWLFNTGHKLCSMRCTELEFSVWFVLCFGYGISALPSWHYLFARLMFNNHKNVWFAYILPPTNW